jgi:hypothetical protein
LNIRFIKKKTHKSEFLKDSVKYSTVRTNAACISS